MVNSEKFIFPSFEFRAFNVQGPDVHIKWGDIQKIYEFYKNLQSYLTKALSIIALHSGNSKQNGSLAHSIFDKTTAIASSCYFLHHPVMSGFIDIFQNGGQLQIPNSSFTLIS